MHVKLHYIRKQLERQPGRPREDSACPMNSWILNFIIQKATRNMYQNPPWKTFFKPWRPLKRCIWTASQCRICTDLGPCGRIAVSTTRGIHTYATKSQEPPLWRLQEWTEPGGTEHGKKAWVPVQGNHLSFSSFSAFLYLWNQGRWIELILEGTFRNKNGRHPSQTVSMFSNFKKWMAFIKMSSSRS